ncbi:uncharacterized protein [Pagrus major]|uniref:uncharacterized protein n=1 Tax=Pagrus major TaxID=143350 RepID=UPI003CC88DC4
MQAKEKISKKTGDFSLVLIVILHACQQEDNLEVSSKFGFGSGEVMYRENEDEVMSAPGVCSDGSSCRHMFAPLLRGRKSGSCVKHLRWLQIQLLVILLIVYYFVDLTVDVKGKEKDETEIKAWLIQVFQNNLESCGYNSANKQQHNSSCNINNVIKQQHNYSFNINNVIKQQHNYSYNSANKQQHNSSCNINNVIKQQHNSSCNINVIKQQHNSSCNINNDNRQQHNSSCNINNVIKQQHNSSCNINVIKQQHNSSCNINNDNRQQHNSSCNSNNVNRQQYNSSCNINVIKQQHNSSCNINNVTNHQHNCDQTGTWQWRTGQTNEEPKCQWKQTHSSNTNCVVMLKLKHSVPPCCVLRTLCAASKTSSDIQAVGRKADRTSQLQTECNSSPEEEKACIYNGPTGGSCIQSCRAILRFARQVPICAVSEALINVFQSEKQISYNGLVTRTAICGNSAVSDNPLNSPFTCHNGKTLALLLQESCVHRPPTTSSPNVTTAQPNTTTLSVNVTSPPLNTTTKALNTTNTTTSANITVTSPPLNTTTEALNTTNTTANANITVTSPPLNTTTEALNTTTTTASANITVTSPPLNTTTEALNTTTTTASANITVTTTLKNMTTTTANESVSTTQSADSQANALLDLTRDVSNLNSSQVEQLVSQLEDLLSGPTVSLALGNTSVHIVSNLLDASPEVLATSSNRIIGIVDTVGLKLVLDQPAETILSEAVALSVKTADGTNFQGTVFSISDPSNVQVRGDPRLRRSVRTDSTIPQGSIRLPPSLTQDLTSEEQQQASRVQFNFYQKSTVFQDRSLGERKLNSGILGASVANLSITGLQDDVIIHLRNTEPVPANFVAKCVFWDFTFNDGSGGWSSSGCFVRNSTDNETVCSCNHLTSFAILLDLSREPLTSRVQATILTFITYIGCGVSAIFLSITLLTYLAFGKLRKDIPSKILIQLCLALLMLNLVFLVDAWLALYPEAEGLCISTAWFLHYFLLATFTWMGLEAVHMYLALVKVFNSYISHYMVKFSLVGWGVPMIVVIIVIAIDKNNYGLVSYGRFADGTSDDFCWLKNDIAFYVAVVAYFCVIFLFNFVMFIVVLIQLCRIKRQNPHNSLHRSTLQDARSVAGITLLLGLTWGFAFFAWGPVNLAFMYLFAIFNSLQGFFIFVFHCAAKENVRRQWRTYLCCGRMRLAENSEWSRTATQKTMKKASVTRLTSLQSSKSNNSSSSSTFLVSESSEQINGIGSPFDDRTITADENPSSDVILNEINRQYRNQQAP